MGHVWLQVLPKPESAGDPLPAVQESVMLRRLEKYPGDFVAHCNLGALFAREGRYGESALHFEQALAASLRALPPGMAWERICWPRTSS